MDQVVELGGLHLLAEVAVSGNLCISEVNHQEKRSARQTRRRHRSE
jgi:hypothetical protein